jgi:hypothetical protein
MAKRAIDASQQFDYRNDRLRGGRERSSAEWGTRRCSPQTGMAELGGIKLGRMKLYSTAKRVAQLRFFNHGFRALCYIEQRRCRFLSRNGNDLSRFDELCDQVAAELEVDDAILDGEVIAADETSRIISGQNKNTRLGLQGKPRVSGDCQLVGYRGR